MVKREKRKQKTVKRKQNATQPLEQNETQTLMEWTVHMARKQPAKAAAIVAIIASALAIGWIWVHPFVAFLMALFLLNAVSEFLFPVHYKVTNGSIEVSSFLQDRKIRWEQIRRFNVFQDSIFLSPYPKPSRLDSLRGVWLRWDGEPEGFQKLVQICQAKVQTR